MLTIEKNLAEINRLIAQAAHDAGRLPTDITLVAVSKGQGFSAIKEAYRAGQRHFGESYAQEMQEKIWAAHSEGFHDITWHFIGHIQTNKLKIIAQANVIHSIGCERHARALNALLTTPKPIFLQINLDKNPKRQGFFPDDIIDEISRLRTLDKLLLKGLMCILPIEANSRPAYWFSLMNRLKEQLKTPAQNLKLSMGMSEDFLPAIAHHADYIRIGSKIFMKVS